MSSFAEGEPTTLEDFVFQSKINQSIRDTDKHYQEYFLPSLLLNTLN